MLNSSPPRRFLRRIGAAALCAYFCALQVVGAPLHLAHDHGHEPAEQRAVVSANGHSHSHSHHDNHHGHSHAPDEGTAPVSDHGHHHHQATDHDWDSLRAPSLSDRAWDAQFALTNEVALPYREQAVATNRLVPQRTYRAAPPPRASGPRAPPLS